MSKTAVAHGGKPVRSVSVASKPSSVRRPGTVSSKPSVQRAGAAASKKTSSTRRPGAVSSKPSVQRAGAASSKTSVKRPGKASSKTSSTKRPRAVSSKTSSTKRPRAVSSKTSSTRRPGAVSSKPSLVRRPTTVSSKPSLARRRAAAKPTSNRTFYIVCGVISLLSAAIIIVMGSMYISVKEVKTPHDVPLDQLRTTLAVALNRPDLEQSGPTQIAEEVKNLPNSIKVAQAVYDERKRKYRNLFHKTIRSSSGPWKLHRRSLYYFSKGVKTWYDAESFCVSRDAHLASVLDEEEQNFISSQLQHTSWIGLTAENGEGTWRWSDGSRLVAQYWSDGKPGNGAALGESSQDCTLMVPSLTDHNWNDENCHKIYGWICKESLDLEP